MFPRWLFFPPLPVSHSRKTMGIKIKVIILLSIHFWPAVLPGCTEETPGSPRSSPGQWPQSLWVGCELEAATSQTLWMSLKGFCLTGSGHMVSLLSTLPAKKPKILLKWICEAIASNSTSQIPWGIEPAWRHGVKWTYFHSGLRTALQKHLYRLLQHWKWRSVTYNLQDL